jgi:nucleoside-diphosphate-sugar epimerase
MKLLVTGAFGFTGRHFTRIARAQGHEIIELKVDLKDREAVKTAVLQAEPEAVVHLAAISFVGHADASAFYLVNVVGTLNLLDALAALINPPKSILLASSANVYGNCDQSPISENQIPSPVNHYGVSKLAMEQMARSYLDRLPLFFVRPFNYTGPGQAESFLIPKLVAHFAKRAESVELGNLEVEREFNDVRFVCEAYLCLLNTGKPGEIYNVCSGKPAALKSVIALLHDISGYSLQVKVSPACIRSNELHRLCGDPTKLINEVGPLAMPALRDTLCWMLESREAFVSG